jgi:hypothetical protein
MRKAADMQEEVMQKGISVDAVPRQTTHDHTMIN